MVADAVEPLVDSIELDESRLLMLTADAELMGPPAKQRVTDEFDELLPRSGATDL